MLRTAKVAHERPDEGLEKTNLLNLTLIRTLMRNLRRAQYLGSLIISYREIIIIKKTLFKTNGETVHSDSELLN